LGDDSNRFAHSIQRIRKQSFGPTQTGWYVQTGEKRFPHGRYLFAINAEIGVLNSPDRR
jgi:hypothetical protein